MGRHEEFEGLGGLFEIDNSGIDISRKSEDVPRGILSRFEDFNAGGAAARLAGASGSETVLTFAKV